MNQSVAPFDFLDHFRQQSPQFSEVTQANLALRKKELSAYFQSLYQEFRAASAERALNESNSFDLLDQHTAWMDAWVTFTWEFAQQETGPLRLLLIEESQQKLTYFSQSLPGKQAMVQDLKEFLYNEQGEPNPLDPAEFTYYSNQLENLIRQTQALETEHTTLAQSLPRLKAYKKPLKKGLPFCVFARGGYGRGELSFSSDVDLAYCLNQADFSPTEYLILQERIKRCEELFHDQGGDIASQYLELGEDFSRFKEKAALHALPAILEGRLLIGKQQVLEQLKSEIQKAIPLERMSLWLMEQQQALIPKGNDQLQVKEGWGGLRHLQYSLWLALIFFKPTQSGFRPLLRLLEKRGLLPPVDRQHLEQAFEFYYGYRNFVGLFEFYRPLLQEMGEEQLAATPPEKDLINDHGGRAFLKLVQRFTTIDDLDRFRIFSMKKVANLSIGLTQSLSDRTVVEKLKYFKVYKHLGTGQIHHLVDLKGSTPLKRQTRDQLEQQIQNIFKEFPPLFELFIYLAQRGLKLHPRLTGAFSSRLPWLFAKKEQIPTQEAKEFIFQLFQAEFAHIAISQAWEISLPLQRSGEHQSLLGLFLPEADQMRYLLRNLNIHAYPLCEHSLLALEQVETEVKALKEREPELWHFIGKNDIFALKWATFFHDLGKINPYRDHELLGPILSTKLLLELGWDENDSTLNLIRLLIRHHQSVVRFSRLSTYIDVGIVKFFGLTERDPRQMILLYLVNLADFKSVNPRIKEQAAHLEDFFNKTLEILAEVKQSMGSHPLSEVVENFLEGQIKKLNQAVVLELLLKHCILNGLDQAIFHPLAANYPKELKALKKEQSELGRSLHFLSLGELDEKNLARHRQNFQRILTRHFPAETLRPLSGQEETHLSWFFTSVPNRYLLSMNPQALAGQIIDLADHQDKRIRFSYTKGQTGEYDTLLFTGAAKSHLQSKVGFLLGQLGYNIENGKINPVYYQNGQKGLVGFFQFSRLKEERETLMSELENHIEHLRLPQLYNLAKKLHKKTNIQIQFIPEKKKAYLVQEDEQGYFTRKKTEKIAMKVSLFDQPYCYFKLMAALEAFDIYPSQVTITTIGRQIIDYFYIRPDEQEKVQSESFQAVLQEYLQSEISNQNLNS